MKKIKLPYGKWDVRIFDLDRSQKSEMPDSKTYSRILKSTIDSSKHSDIFSKNGQSRLVSNKKLKDVIRKSLIGFISDGCFHFIFDASLFQDATKI